MEGVRRRGSERCRKFLGKIPVKSRMACPPSTHTSTQASVSPQSDEKDCNLSDSFCNLVDLDDLERIAERELKKNHGEKWNLKEKDGDKANQEENEFGIKKNHIREHKETNVDNILSNSLGATTLEALDAMDLSDGMNVPSPHDAGVQKEVSNMQPMEEFSSSKSGQPLESHVDSNVRRSRRLIDKQLLTGSLDGEQSIRHSLQNAGTLSSSESHKMPSASSSSNRNLESHKSPSELAIRHENQDNTSDEKWTSASTSGSISISCQKIKAVNPRTKFYDGHLTQKDANNHCENGRLKEGRDQPKLDVNMKRKLGDDKVHDSNTDKWRKQSSKAKVASDAFTYKCKRKISPCSDKENLSGKHNKRRRHHLWSELGTAPSQTPLHEKAKSGQYTAAEKRSHSPVTDVDSPVLETEKVPKVKNTTSKSHSKSVKDGEHQKEDHKIQGKRNEDDAKNITVKAEEIKSGTKIIGSHMVSKDASHSSLGALLTAASAYKTKPSQKNSKSHDCPVKCIQITSPDHTIKLHHLSSSHTGNVTHDLTTKSAHNTTQSPHTTASESHSFLSSQEKLELSSWGLPESVLEKYQESGIQTMFPWQAECLSQPGVVEGRNLVYSAPTSAGKTLVAEMLLLKRVLEDGKKGLFILPFVSVAREKMYYLQKMFGVAGVRVEGFMGSQSPPGGLSNTDIAVCTIEKANNLINRLVEEDVNGISHQKKTRKGKGGSVGLGSIGVVVVDELHLVGDQHRGYLLELLLTKLTFLAHSSHHTNDGGGVQIIGMSATLPNLSLLAQWLGKAALYATSHRPVPLRETIKLGTRIYDADGTCISQLSPDMAIQGDSEHVTQLCLETVLEGYSVLIFCPTKVWCEALAATIAKHFFNIGRTDSKYSNEVGERLRTALDREGISRVLEALRASPSGLDSSLARTIAFGSAYHHAGLTLDERDIVEGGFRAGSVRVLVATSTLCSGVNLPARRVIIRSLSAGGGGYLDPLTYKQMVGRAGRKGVDTEGESIVVCSNDSEVRRARSLLSQRTLPPITSCLHTHTSLSASMKRAILEVIASGLATTPEEVNQYCNCTLLAASLRAGDGGSSDREQDREDTSTSGNSNSSQHCTQDSVIACVAFLEENEFIRHQEDGDSVRLVGTQLGLAVMASGLSPDEGLRVFSELRRARQCFVLENELHIIYQVTPTYISNGWARLDWAGFLSAWEELGEGGRRVGQLVGVQESFIFRAMKGAVNIKARHQAELLGVHQRFFTALALRELVQEVPVGVVAARFGVSKGALQALQHAAATFAGMVTVMCGRLGWDNMALLLAQYMPRLHHGARGDLCDLLRLPPPLDAPTARHLHSAGLATVAAISRAGPHVVEQILHSATPFHSNKFEGSEGRVRQAGRLVLLVGGRPLTEAQAARLIVAEARQMVQKDLGIFNIDWSRDIQDPLTSQHDSSPCVLHGKLPVVSRDLDMRMNLSAARGRKRLSPLAAAILRRKSKSPRCNSIIPCQETKNEKVIGTSKSLDQEVEPESAVSKKSQEHKSSHKSLETNSSQSGSDCEQRLMKMDTSKLVNSEYVICNAGSLKQTESCTVTTVLRGTSAFESQAKYSPPYADVKNQSGENKDVCSKGGNKTDVNENDLKSKNLKTNSGEVEIKCRGGGNDACMQELQQQQQHYPDLHTQEVHKSKNLIEAPNTSSDKQNRRKSCNKDRSELAGLLFRRTNNKKTKYLHEDKEESTIFILESQEDKSDNVFSPKRRKLKGKTLAEEVGQQALSISEQQFSAGKQVDKEENKEILEAIPHVITKKVNEACEKKTNEHTEFVESGLARSGLSSSSPIIDTRPSLTEPQGNNKMVVFSSKAVSLKFQDNETCNDRSEVEKQPVTREDDRDLFNDSGGQKSLLNLYENLPRFVGREKVGSEILKEDLMAAGTKEYTDSSKKKCRDSVDLLTDSQRENLFLAMDSDDFHAESIGDVSYKQYLRNMSLNDFAEEGVSIKDEEHVNVVENRVTLGISTNSEENTSITSVICGDQHQDGPLKKKSPEYHEPFHQCKKSVHENSHSTEDNLQPYADDMYEILSQNQQYAELQAVVHGSSKDSKASSFKFYHDNENKPQAYSAVHDRQNKDGSLDSAFLENFDFGSDFSYCEESSLTDMEKSSFPDHHKWSSHKQKRDIDASLDGSYLQCNLRLSSSSSSVTDVDTAVALKEPVSDEKGERYPQEENEKGKEHKDMHEPKNCKLRKYQELRDDLTVEHMKGDDTISDSFLECAFESYLHEASACDALKKHTENVVTESKKHEPSSRVEFRSSSDLKNNATKEKDDKIQEFDSSRVPGQTKQHVDTSPKPKDNVGVMVGVTNTLTEKRPYSFSELNITPRTAAILDGKADMKSISPCIENKDLYTGIKTSDVGGKCFNGVSIPDLEIKRDGIGNVSSCLQGYDNNEKLEKRNRLSDDLFLSPIPDLPQEIDAEMRVSVGKVIQTSGETKQSEALSRCNMTQAPQKNYNTPTRVSRRDKNRGEIFETVISTATDFYPCQKSSKSTAVSEVFKEEVSEQSRISLKSSSQSTEHSPSVSSSFWNTTSLCIIDVTSDPEVFSSFLKEVQQQTVFSLSFACQKVSRQDEKKGGIGWRISHHGRSGRHSKSNRGKGVTGVVVGTSELLVVGVAVCWGSRDAYYLNLRTVQDEPLDVSMATPPLTADVSLQMRLEAVRQLLDNEGGRVVQVWDAKKMVGVAAAAGLGCVSGAVEDPRVAAWLLHPTDKEPSLHNLVVNYHPESLEVLQGAAAGQGVVGLGMDTSAPVSPRVRSAMECVAVFHLTASLRSRLDQEGLLMAYTEVEMPSLVSLAYMELNGMGLSNKECQEQKTLLQTRLKALESEAFEHAGHTFSLSSPAQIARVLYSHLRLPQPGSTEIPPTTSRGVAAKGGRLCGPTHKEALQELTAIHPLPGLILEWRKINATLTKVVCPLQQAKVNCRPLAMDRIHPTAYTFTATGRITLHSPCLQSVPRDFTIKVESLAKERTGSSTRGLQYQFANTAIMNHLAPKTSDGVHEEKTVSVRRALVAGRGRVLLAADYCQLELRLLAHFSSDSYLLATLGAGGQDKPEVFTCIAAQLHGISHIEVTPVQRQKAKQICYGLLYGMGEHTLSEELGTTEEDAHKFLKTFQAMYPGAYSYLHKAVDTCRAAGGMVYTLMGRRRHLPNIDSTDPYLRGQSERQAVNTQIQGSGADLVKLAAVRIESELQQAFPSAPRYLTHPAAARITPLRGAYLVLHLHDELIYEVCEEDVVQVSQVVKQHMEEVWPLTVPLQVKLQVGQSWGNLQPFTL